MVHRNRESTTLIDYHLLTHLTQIVISDPTPDPPSEFREGSKQRSPPLSLQPPDTLHVNESITVNVILNGIMSLLVN